MANNVALSNKKYNDTLCALWLKKSGNYVSMEIDAKNFDKIQKLEIGDKIIVKMAPSKKGDTSPDAYLERISKDDVAKFNDERKNADNSSDRNPSPGRDEDVAF